MKLKDWPFEFPGTPGIEPLGGGGGGGPGYPG